MSVINLLEHIKIKIGAILFGKKVKEVNSSITPIKKIIVLSYQILAVAITSSLDRIMLMKLRRA